MIILPDRNIPRAKFLTPIHFREWRTPSLTQSKDQAGNENVTLFRIDARSNDGVVVWTGWFKDRDDFDAFLWALVQGRLKQEKVLWDLPTPNWQPYLGELISYDFATTTFLSTPTETNTAYTMPSDFNTNDNNIQAIGAGATGGRGTSVATGGGGGAWNRTNNVKAVRNAVEYYRIGAGGALITGTAGTQNGNNGGDTWFSINNAAPTNTTEGVLAKGGSGGLGSGSGGVLAGGAGGVGASGIGTSSFNGGAGGSTGSAATAIGTGGGGAAGPSGAGGTVAFANNTLTGTAGANGAGTGGGVGSAGQYSTISARSSAGGVGTNIQVSPAFGSGGGSGGTASAFNAVSITGTGGPYGGASGGARSSTGINTANNGGNGLIIITYEPLTRFGQPFNMPNSGL